MREIKFRAWDTESKVMWDWDEMQEWWEDVGYHDNMLRGNHYVPMQYTGLKDSEGTEIYEGDILESVAFGSEEIGKIVYSEDDAMFELDIDGVVLKFSNESSKWWTVIGNICENPELLGE